jgi:hypothetical protein
MSVNFCGNNFSSLTNQKIGVLRDIGNTNREKSLVTHAKLEECEKAGDNNKYCEIASFQIRRPMS